MHQDQVSIKPKILIGFLLGVLAIGAYYGINRWQVKGLSDTIINLSDPDIRIQLLNEIFQEIIQIDQAQRSEVAGIQLEDRPNLMAHSKVIPKNLASLQSIFESDSNRLKQIDTLSILLKERDRLHVIFLRDKIKLLRLDGANTSTFDSISTIVADQSMELQSDRISYVKKSSTTRVETTDTIKISTPPPPKKPGFFNRIFSRNKDKETEDDLFLAQDQIVEDVYEVYIDSFITARKDTLLLEKIENQLTKIREEQIRRNKTLLGKELNYVSQSNELINYALGLIQTLEIETFYNSRQESATALTWASRGLSLSSILLALFSVGALILVSLILLDITKARKFRLQLEEEKEKVIHLTKVKELFLANISHEIKTPLQAIIGYSDAIQTSSNGNINTDLNLLKSSTEQLLFLVNDILDFSKISSEKFILKSEKFYLSNMWMEVISVEQMKATDKDIEFQVFIPDVDFQVWSDKYRIKQVFHNIINNAIKFTDSGFVRLEVTYHEVSDRYIDLIVTVSDSGAGIAEEDQNRIFQYFEQSNHSDPQGLKGGTGLGLAIVSQIIKALDGDIKLSSKRNQGSEFTVTIRLPFIPQDPHSIENVPKEDILPPRSLSLPIDNDLIIYVMDDDLQILNIIKRYMSDWQIPIRFFDHPEELIQDFSHTSKVILLTDLRLGSLSGLDLIKRISQNTDKERLQCILMTAQSIEEEQLKGNLGVDHLLPKPFRYEELFRAISSAAKHLGCSFKESTELTSQCDDAPMPSLKDQNLLDLSELAQACKEGDVSQAVHLLHQLSSRFGFAGDTTMYLQLRKYELQIRTSPENETLLIELQQIIEDYITNQSDPIQ